MAGWLALVTSFASRRILEVSDKRLANVVVAVVAVTEILDGHVGLDIGRLDRIHLNAYVPKLQMGGQVVTFLREHVGNPIPLARGAGENRHGVPPRGSLFCYQQPAVAV